MEVKINMLRCGGPKLLTRQSWLAAQVKTKSDRIVPAKSISFDCKLSRLSLNNSSRCNVSSKQLNNLNGTRMKKENQCGCPVRRFSGAVGQKWLSTRNIKVQDWTTAIKASTVIGGLVCGVAVCYSASKSMFKEEKFSTLF